MIIIFSAKIFSESAERDVIHALFLSKSQDGDRSSISVIAYSPNEIRLEEDAQNDGLYYNGRWREVQYCIFSLQNKFFFLKRIFKKDVMEK